MPLTTAPTTLNRPLSTFRFTCPANGSEDTLTTPGFAWVKVKNGNTVDITLSTGADQAEGFVLSPGETSDWLPMVDELGNAVTLYFESTTAATGTVYGVAAQAPSLGLAR